MEEIINRLNSLEVAKAVQGNEIIRLDKEIVSLREEIVSLSEENGNIRVRLL